MRNANNDPNKHLSKILHDFNKVLADYGIEGEVVRFMIGDPNNPDQVKAQKAIDKMLQDIHTTEISPLAFWCCDGVTCRICEIA